MHSVSRSMATVFSVLMVFHLSACQQGELSEGTDGAFDCSSCHGTESSSAPPVSISGETETTSIGVGAHQIHLQGGKIRAALKCSDCHVVPTTVEEHVDPLPAELTWGELATANGAEPEWDRENATCRSVYCHGEGLAGGKHSEPVWTLVDGTQSTCDSCHGAPPPAPHPQSNDCWSCHPNTVNSDGTINLEGGKHINGSVDLKQGSTGCDACHGNPPDAPHPASNKCWLCHSQTVNEDGTINSDAGTHQNGKVDLGKETGCASCHGNPPDAPHPDSNECSTCHSGTVNEDGTINEAGGLHMNGSVDVGGSQGCASCHGNPPDAPHPNSTECSICHSGTVNEDGTINEQGGLHMNGSVDVGGSQGCNSCHGNPPDAPHPASTNCNLCHPKTVLPDGSINENDGFHMNSQVDVGDDQASCDTCHGNPPAAPHPSDSGCSKCHSATVKPDGTINSGSGAHMNGTGDVDVLGCNACHGNPPDAPHPAATECSQCHSATVNSDGTINTEGAAHRNGSVEVDVLGCASCHGNPPDAPHPDSTRCTMCHPGTVGEDGTIIEGGLHRNAQVDSQNVHQQGWASPSQHGAGFIQEPSSCAACHGSQLDGGIADVSCEACHPTFRKNCVFCHGGTDNQLGAPPVAVGGGTATTLPGVGAHSSHLTADPEWHKPLACNDCHKVPADALDQDHINGLAALSWGSAATGAGRTNPDYTDTTCSGIYCHGATLTGGQHTSPDWILVDGNQTKCTSCHGNPPPAPHPDSDQCELCHGEVIGADQVWVNAARHIDGNLDYDGVHPEGWDVDHRGAFNSSGPAACTSCHGSDLTGGSSGVSCEQCHGGFKTNCTFCHGGLDNNTGAPPWDMADNQATTATGVGAHTVHLAGSNWHRAISCNECHQVPTSALSANHVDGGDAEVSFGELARKEDGDPAWNGTSCSATYCHGSSLSGGQHTNPVWTQVDGTQSNCTSCHSMPPSSEHPDSDECWDCHGCVVNLSRQIIPERAYLHINGKIDWSSNCQNQ